MAEICPQSLVERVWGLLASMPYRSLFLTFYGAFEGIFIFMNKISNLRKFRHICPPGGLELARHRNVIRIL